MASSRHSRENRFQGESAEGRPRGNRTGNEMWPKGGLAGRAVDSGADRTYGRPSQLPPRERAGDVASTRQGKRYPANDKVSHRSGDYGPSRLDRAIGRSQYGF